MGLLDIGIGLAEKYGPAALQALGNLNRGTGAALAGSPMYPSLGFAAPRGGATGTFGLGRKKKRRGLSASDIRGAQKVARLVQAFGFRPKIKARKRRR